MDAYTVLMYDERACEIGKKVLDKLKCEIIKIFHK